MVLCGKKDVAANTKYKYNDVDNIIRKQGYDPDKIIRDNSHFTEDKKLKPNVVYQAGENGYYYVTNEYGYVVHAIAPELAFRPERKRLSHFRKTFGKRATDQAGHIFADLFGGSPKLDNMVSQAQLVNQSTYRILEKKWERALKKGQHVSVDVRLEYDEVGRPTKFMVEYTIDDTTRFQEIHN